MEKQQLSEKPRLMEENGRNYVIKFDRSLYSFSQLSLVELSGLEYQQKRTTLDVVVGQFKLKKERKNGSSWQRKKRIGL